MHNYLLDIISKNVLLTEKDRELYIQCFEPILFPKNRIVEKEGESHNTYILLYQVLCGFFIIMKLVMK